MTPPAVESHATWDTLPMQGAGRSVIEASAGTGKTYTIGMMYLRSLLENGHPPREILVTTFTRAAAAEISGRVRAVLEAAFEHAAGRPATHDGVKHWLDQRWATGVSRAADVARLGLAIAGFDQGAIGTLHSICQRILGEHPFAVRSGFIAPVLVDSKDLHTGIARDLWRRMVSPSDATGLRDAFTASGLDFGFDAFKAQFQKIFSDGLILDAPSAEALDPALLPPAWTPEALDDFLKRARLNKTHSSSKGAERFARHYRQAHGALDAIALDSDIEAVAEKRFVLAKDSPVSADELLAFEHFIRPRVRWLKARARVPTFTFWQRVLTEANTIREREMAAARVLTFDAVLGRVRDALRQEAHDHGGSRPLADTLFAAWPIALVDEFQDTDGIQFEILDRIYSDAHGRPRGRLVMIGDPKQSIYRFRGADVNVFTRATGAADPRDRLTLACNYRSSAPYVQAINFLYANTNDDLGGPGQRIHYHAVDASTRCDASPFKLGGRAAPPLTLWLDARKEDGNALRICADQIAALLMDASAEIGSARVAPGDIAVLLTSNADVYAMVDALRVLGVPAVSKSTRSVFSSETAQELQVLLHAVAHAGSPSVRRAAAATGLWGGSFEALRESAANEGLDRTMADTLARWHEAWVANGPLHVIARVIAHTAPAQLKTQAGERVLTDLRHLGELLQAQTRNGDSLETQLAWLAHQIEETAASSDDESAEAKNMRMESDDKRVQVMTLHASKGLEFPIVFLPTAWKRAPVEIPPFVYTDDDGLRRISPFEEAKAASGRERDHERRRLLYVALTRAIHACHVYVKEPLGVSPAGELLEHHRAALTSDAARAHGVWVKEHWPQVAGGLVCDRGSTDTGERVARRMPARVGSLLERHSFSTLTRASKHVPTQERAPADDEQDVSGEGSIENAPLDAIASLDGVKGAELGNALHAVLEQRDFSRPLLLQVDAIEHQLSVFGVQSAANPRALAQASAHMLDRALKAPLQLPHARDFSLSLLQPAQTRAEMEFNFELPGLNLHALRSLLGEHGLSSIMPSHAFEVRGLLNGHIDLVFDSGNRFHVLDYKSNSLGATDADYTGERLIAHMDASHYRFQALIYVLALDRYLRSRIPGYARSQHLGEAVYLFLRAARPGSTAGVWSYRFDDALIEAVQQLFAGGTALAGHAA